MNTPDPLPSATPPAAVPGAIGDARLAEIRAEPLAPEELADLRKRHTPPVIPPCRVCGAEMSIGAADWVLIVYSCSAVQIGSEGWSEHYDRSRREVRRTDDRVLTLLDEHAALAAEVLRLRGEVDKAREDERERIAMAIEARRDILVEHGHIDIYRSDCYSDSASIARGPVGAAGAAAADGEGGGRPAFSEEYPGLSAAATSLAGQLVDSGEIACVASGAGEIIVYTIRRKPLVKIPQTVDGWPVKVRHSGPFAVGGEGGGR